ncbi:hypothetical protein IMSAGC011_02658 [Lachnospiraceae bacterium]|nr:hypothetical protein IMSAGC011_02658 [Lachnospiraceae bacterium]
MLNQIETRIYDYPPTRNVKINTSHRICYENIQNDACKYAILSALMINAVSQSSLKNMIKTLH